MENSCRYWFYTLQYLNTYLNLHLYNLRAQLSLNLDVFLWTLFSSLNMYDQWAQVNICTRAQRAQRAQVFIFICVLRQCWTWGMTYRHQTLNVRVSCGLSYWKNTFRLNIFSKVCQKAFCILWTYGNMQLYIYIYSRSVFWSSLFKLAQVW